MSVFTPFLPFRFAHCHNEKGNKKIGPSKAGENVGDPFSLGSAIEAPGEEMGEDMTTCIWSDFREYICRLAWYVCRRVCRLPSTKLTGGEELILQHLSPFKKRDQLSQF